MSIFNRGKVRKLQIEVERLNSELDLMREQQLSIRELDKTARTLKQEISQLQDNHNSLVSKIHAFKKEENQRIESLNQLESKISSLKEVKNVIQENVLASTTRLSELETLLELNESKLGEVEDQKRLIEEQKNTRNEIERIREKIGELLQEEDLIKDRISKKQDEILLVENKLAELSEKEKHNFESINLQESTLQNLEAKCRNIDLELDSKNRLLSEITSQLGLKREENEQLKKQQELLQAEVSEHRLNIAALTEEEKSKYGILKNLTVKIKAFEQHAQKLYSNLTFKSDQLKEVTVDLKSAAEALTNRQEELASVNSLLNVNEEKFAQVKAEIANLEQKKNQITISYTEMQNLKYENDKLEEKYAKMGELVSLLEQRKTEIEQGNSELEARFMKLFQKLNKELNDINKKRNVLEQVLLKKDKDLDDKDQMLFEKIAALEESERILNIRQVEIESTDQVLNSTSEQREYLWNELQKLEDEAIERKGINEDLRLETDLLFKKKSVIEKNFQDLLNTMNQNYSKLRERNTGFQKEFKHYEDEFDVVRARISESMKELDEVQNAISTLKLEQEQHKGSISKLMSTKRRIQDEITKHQSILQRYQRIREKLNSEQSLSKYKDEHSDKSTQELNAQIYKL